MSEVGALQFLTTLRTNFRVKRHESDAHEERWVAMMIAELKGFSDEVLEQAAKDLSRRRKNEYFPILSECINACQDAKHWIEMASPKLKFKAAQDAEPGSDDRQRLADQLIMGEMGRQAANEGWVLTLWCYVRDNGRLPEQRQISKLRAEAKGFDHALDQCRAGGWQQAMPLAALGSSILAKRQELTERVLHGVTK